MTARDLGSSNIKIADLCYIKNVRIPKEMDWLFWDVDPNALDLERDSEYLLGRLLERGRLQDVRWALRTYGLDRIHRFFRESGHSELSGRTLSFWRAFFRAEDEIWKTPPSWRVNSSAPWVG